MNECVDKIVDCLLSKFETKKNKGIGGIKTHESTEIINKEMQIVLSSEVNIKTLQNNYRKVKALKAQAIAYSATTSLKLTIIALLISALSVVTSLISILRTNNFQFANNAVIVLIVVLVGLLLKQLYSIKRRPDNYIYNLSYLENLLKAEIDELSAKIKEFRGQIN